MTDKEQIDSIRSEYGNHKSSDPGNWLDMRIDCPVCKQGIITVEPNMELGDNAAASDTLAECNNCDAKFDWAYIVEPQVFITQVE